MGRGEKDENNITDLELIRRSSEGEIRAQELLYRRFFSFAMSVCIRYTKDEHEAMETVNDSFMKVLEKLDGYDTSRPFKAWYGKILVNTAIDNYRKKARQSSFLSVDAVAETEEHDPEIEAELSAGDIIALFRQLPEQYRITFNLCEIEGYSHEEISIMLGISHATSRANLARAKKMLRELYIRKQTAAGRINEAI